jgi:hypothetical protein
VIVSKKMLCKLSEWYVYKRGSY